MYLQSPRLRLAVSRVAQLVERDVLVVLVVVEPEAVPLYACRVDLEFKGGAFVIVAVEGDCEPVGGGVVVPPRKPPDDLAGLGIEGGYPYIYVFIVVEDPEVCLLGGRLAVVRLTLDEAGRYRGEAPVDLGES
jgi:hypothetical protein